MIENLDELIVWLEVDDAKSWPYRAARLRLLVDHYGANGNGRMFFGGHVSVQAFEEARRTFLDGSFLSCIMMCQICIEHMLAGLFRMEGRDDLDRASFQRLLEEARFDCYLSVEEFELFERLRSVRNPYAHPRPPAGPGSIMERAMTMDSSFDDLIVADAEAAVKALLHLCSRAPFAM